jgi:hypothetical protein
MPGQAWTLGDQLRSDTDPVGAPIRTPVRVVRRSDPEQVDDEDQRLAGLDRRGRALVP